MMQWLSDIFLSHSAVQAVIVLSLLCACGLAMGKIKVLGVSLGVAFVFFLGILAGQLGISIDPRMLQYAQNFGLVLFVYALGLQVGPGFFGSFHKSGLTLNMLALAVVLVGTILTLLLPLLVMVTPLPLMLALMPLPSPLTVALPLGEKTTVTVRSYSERSTAVVVSTSIPPVPVLSVVSVVAILSLVQPMKNIGNANRMR